MNTTHTPGPWQQGDGYNAHTTTVHIKSTLIAKAETEADARLIAAAPDLLEALKFLIDMDVAYQRGPRVEEAVEVAREAIAKATGVK